MWTDRGSKGTESIPNLRHLRNLWIVTPCPRQLSAALKSDDGIDRLDAIAMMLIVLGESVKNLDKATDGTLLPQFPEVDWKGAKGVRDIMSHHYVDIDAEVIFDICQTFIPPLIATIEKMRQEIVNGTV